MSCKLKLWNSTQNSISLCSLCHVLSMEKWRLTYFKSPWILWWQISCCWQQNKKRKKEIIQFYTIHESKTIIINLNYKLQDLRRTKAKDRQSLSFCSKTGTLKLSHSRWKQKEGKTAFSPIDHSPKAQKDKCRLLALNPLTLWNRGQLWAVLNKTRKQI